MVLSRVFLGPLSVTALLGSVTVLSLNIAAALATESVWPTIRRVAIVASICEGLALIPLLALSTLILLKSNSLGSRGSSSVWLALSLTISLLATIISVVVLILLGIETDGKDFLGRPKISFVVGTAVALGITFAAQLSLIIIGFMTTRSAITSPNHSPSRNEKVHRPSHLKAIRYSQTIVTDKQPGEIRPMDQHQSRPGSSSGRSAVETMSSIRTSLSSTVRSVSSKTRLLPMRSGTGRRAASLDTNGYNSRSQRPSTENDASFDSWDMSAIDPQNRQTVIETASPAQPRFLETLETIPASPTTSRSPSPGYPLDLQPPKAPFRGRSRSYSPVPGSSPGLSSNASTEELHIHPLFRSDSPVPPPAATPGTVVIAAPGAGMVISERVLTRMRSGSLPTARSSLSRQGSFDSFQRKTPSPGLDRLSQPLSESLDEVSGERTITPPIPDFVFRAGSRSSLAEYRNRQLRDHNEEPNDGIGLGISR